MKPVAYHRLTMVICSTMLGSPEGQPEGQPEGLPFWIEEAGGGGKTSLFWSPFCCGGFFMPLFVRLKDAQWCEAHSPSPN